MGLDRCLTEKNGVFEDTAKLQESEPLINSVVAISDSGTLQFFSVDATDLGSGLSLNNGRFANPISDPQTDTNTTNTSTNTTNIAKKVEKSFTVISTATALQIGVKYLSTVTNTHTLADGVTVGDSIIFSWAAGTIGTITGASAIVFTDKDDVLQSDVTWVFDFPIVNIVFVWNGSNWEIQ